MKASKIAELLDKLDELGQTPQVYKNTQYNDEPRFYNYNTILTMPKKNTDGFVSKGEPHGSGVSYFSATDALSKSVWEAMERFCNYSWKKKQIVHLKANNTKYKFIDLSIFSKDPDINNKKLGWVKGFDLFANKPTLIPAQMVYLNYHKESEPHFDYPRNSTGSAGGMNKEHAILNGIYEIIERDSLMGVYLNKISPPIVDLASLKDAKINYLTEKFKKFNLELFVLNTTTDLGIPSFIALVFDKTNRGPAVGISAKAGFNVKDVIIGSIGEVLMTRLYTKNMLQKGDITADLKSATGLFPSRARLWITADTIKNIEFMTQGKKTRLKINSKRLTIKSQFKKVSRILKEKGYGVYYADCTIPAFRKLNFVTYFTFVPGLHPLYLRELERERIVNRKRLSQIAKHFGKEFDDIYRVPHPFL